MHFGFDCRSCFRFLYLLGFTGFISSAQAQYSLVNDPEFLKLREALELRYKDFYAHLKRAEKAEQRRLAGIPDVKKYRADKAARKEAARQKFVAQRKAAPSKEPLRLKWEAEQEKIRQKKEKQRSLYVMRRDEIRRLLNTSKRIPPELELGIESVP